MNTLSLTEKVEQIMLDCLYRDDELHGSTDAPAAALKVRGIVRHFALHPERTMHHKEDIRGLLLDMPKEFHKESGGGMSFLNLCMDRRGEQWGEHSDMEALVVLGIATEQAKFSLPPDMWSILPGGMPYVTFDCGKP